MATQPAADERGMRRVVALLTASALLFICGGVAVGLLVTPIGFVGVAVGLIDLVLARQFSARSERA